jgi:hypothetical protein
VCTSDSESMQSGRCVPYGYGNISVAGVYHMMTECTLTGVYHVIVTACTLTGVYNVMPAHILTGMYHVMTAHPPTGVL